MAAVLIALELSSDYPLFQLSDFFKVNGVNLLVLNRLASIVVRADFIA